MELDTFNNNEELLEELQFIMKIIKIYKIINLKNYLKKILL